MHAMSWMYSATANKVTTPAYLLPIARQYHVQQEDERDPEWITRIPCRPLSSHLGCFSFPAGIGLGVPCSRDLYCPVPAQGLTLGHYLMAAKGLMGVQMRNTPPTKAGVSKL